LVKIAVINHQKQISIGDYGTYWSVPRQERERKSLIFYEVCALFCRDNPPGWRQRHSRPRNNGATSLVTVLNQPAKKLKRLKYTNDHVLGAKFCGKPSSTMPGSEI
jgi:hypothetical protein